MAESFSDHFQETELRVDTQASLRKGKSELKEYGRLCIDNLETYLNDLFKNEVEFTIEKDEVAFIQHGIESLIAKIAGLVIQEACENIDAKQRYDKENIQAVTGVQFIERKTSERILKAGSYYETTKNTFPDEFDFIFILRTFEVPKECQDNLYKATLPFILTGIHAKIGTVLEQKELIENLKYVYTGSKGERIVAFEKPVGISGPSLKLEFKYYNFEKKEAKIDVDFVPAYQIYDQNSEKRMKSICCCHDFSQELTRFGRYYFVTDNMTFTETEVYFMTNVLSPKHVKVYRIVKFLMNGHNDAAELEDLGKQQQVINAHLATYKIKVVTIYHHYSCSHSDDDNLSLCVLELLSTLTKHYKNRTWPRLVNKLNRPYIGKQVNHSKTKKYCEIGMSALKSLYESLLSLQTSAKPYIYKDICIPSFSRSLVRGIQNCDWPEKLDLFVWMG